MLTFTLTDDQEKRVERWKKAHDKAHKALGGQGGSYAIVFGVSSGIGVSARVSCGLCNQSLDVTDYETW